MVWYRENLCIHIEEDEITCEITGKKYIGGWRFEKEDNNDNR